MSFEKEDKSAWLDSEVMQELEKIAQEKDLLKEPESEKKEEDQDIWEDEEAAEPLISKNYLKDELHTAYNNRLFSFLKKLSNDFAEKSNIKVAYRIEKTIHKLTDIIKEDN